MLSSAVFVLLCTSWGSVLKAWGALAALCRAFLMLCSGGAGQKCTEPRGKRGCGLLPERCTLYKKCNCQGGLMFTLGLQDGSSWALSRCVLKAYWYPLSCFSFLLEKRRQIVSSLSQPTNSFWLEKHQLPVCTRISVPAVPFRAGCSGGGTAAAHHCSASLGLICVARS